MLGIHPRYIFLITLIAVLQHSTTVSAQQAAFCANATITANDGNQYNVSETDNQFSLVNCANGQVGFVEFMCVEFLGRPSWDTSIIWNNCTQGCPATANIPQLTNLPYVNLPQAGYGTYEFPCTNNASNHFIALCDTKGWVVPEETYNCVPSTLSCEPFVHSVNNHHLHVPGITIQTEFQVPCPDPYAGLLNFTCGANNDQAATTPYPSSTLTSGACTNHTCPSFYFFDVTFLKNITVPESPIGVSQVACGNGLFGVIDIECQPNGQWGPITYMNCTELYCPASSFELFKGYFVPTPDFYQLNVEAILPCPSVPNITYTGYYVITCQINRATNAPGIAKLANFCYVLFPICPAETFTLSYGENVTVPSINATSYTNNSITGIPTFLVPSMPYSINYTSTCPTGYLGEYTASCSPPSTSHTHRQGSVNVTIDNCVPKQACNAASFTLASGAVVVTPAFADPGTYTGVCTGSYGGTYEVNCTNTNTSNPVNPTLVMDECHVVPVCPASTFKLGSGAIINGPSFKNPGTLHGTCSGIYAGVYMIGCTENIDPALTNNATIIYDGCYVYPLCPATSITLSSGAVINVPALGDPISETIYCTGNYTGNATISCALPTVPAPHSAVTIKKDNCAAVAPCPAQTLEFGDRSLASISLSKAFNHDNQLLGCPAGARGTVNMTCVDSVWKQAKNNCSLPVYDGFQKNSKGLYVSMPYNFTEPGVIATPFTKNCLQLSNNSYANGILSQSVITGQQYCCSKVGLYSYGQCSYNGCSGIKTYTTGFFYDSSTGNCLTNCLSLTTHNTGSYLMAFTGIQYSNFTTINVQSYQFNKALIYQAGPAQDLYGVGHYIYTTLKPTTKRSTTSCTPSTCPTLGCSTEGVYNPTTGYCVVSEQCNTSTKYYTNFIVESGSTGSLMCFTNCYNTMIDFTVAPY